MIELDMDLRDVLERLNEIEFSRGNKGNKLKLYIKLRKDIEKQIC